MPEAGLKSGYVYVLTHAKSLDHYTKIGFSKLHPEKESSKSNSKPRKVHLDFILEAFGFGPLDMPLCEFHDQAKIIERLLHRHFADRRRADVGSSREIFDVAHDDVRLAYEHFVQELIKS